MATHSRNLAWRIPWTEEPGGYGPQAHKESDMTERLRTHRTNIHPRVEQIYIQGYLFPHIFSLTFYYEKFETQKSSKSSTVKNCIPTTQIRQLILCSIWASLVAQMVKNPPTMQETWVRFLGWKDPLVKGTATHSSILAWRIPMDRGAWQATVHGVIKSWT